MLSSPLLPGADDDDANDAGVVPAAVAIVLLPAVDFIYSNALEKLLVLELCFVRLTVDVKQLYLGGMLLNLRRPRSYHWLHRKLEWLGDYCLKLSRGQRSA